MRLCNDVETNPGPPKSPVKQRRGGGRQRGRGGPGGGSRGPSNYNTEDESDSNRSFDRRGSTLESRHEQLSERVDGLKEQVSFILKIKSIFKPPYYQIILIFFGILPSLARGQFLKNAWIP